MSKKSKPSRDELADLLVNDPWWKEISDEIDRVNMVRQLEGVVPDLHKSEVVNVLFEHTLITEEMLRQAESDAVYTEAKKIIGEMRTNDEFPKRLVELYDSKMPDAIERINQAALSLIDVLSDTNIQTEARRIWTSSRKELASVDMNKLPENLNVRTPDDRYIIRSLVQLQNDDELYRNYEQYPFSYEKFFPAEVVDSKDKETAVRVGQISERVMYLAYRVYDPLWAREMHRFEQEYVSFRLKWAGANLSLTEIRRLYEYHKAGGDVVSAFISFYQDENKLDRLKNAIASCPVTRNYGDLFKEAVHSFREKRFRICSMALLPMVEGIIWEYAWWWHNMHGGLFDPAVDYAQYKSRVGYELLKSDGTRAGGRPNIGQLLRQTTFGEAVYFEIVEYLCEELFEERNPVLHGREPNYGSRKKAAALLFVIETLERKITDAFKEQVGKTFTEMLKAGKFDSTEKSH